jgi:hypothetical protein
MSTFGASYTEESVHVQQTTVFKDKGMQGLVRLQAWANARCVVVPMCHGKSIMANRFGGYDVDDMNGDAGEDGGDDAEWDDYLTDREAGVRDQNEEAQLRANRLMELRLRRAMAFCAPDSNPLVVYLHTLEMAAKLGLPVLGCYELAPEAVTASGRMQGYQKNNDMESYDMTMELIAQQVGANRAYATRHGLAKPQRFRDYSGMQRDVEQKLQASGLLVYTRAPYDPESVQSLLRMHGSKKQIDLAVKIIRGVQYSSSERAIAARAVWRGWGEAAPDFAHQHHNHHRWMRWVHTVCSHVDQDVDEYVESYGGELEIDEDTLRERYPMGAGNSKFALFNISDWLDTQASDPKLSHWSTQCLYMLGAESVDVCSYERLGSMLLFDRIVSTKYVDWEGLIYRVPLGLLPTPMFMKRATEAHNMARTSCTYLGSRFPARLLSLFTYWHCLAGRAPGEVDIDVEVEQRAAISAPKYFYSRDKAYWSTEEFDSRLAAKMRNGYMEAATVARKKMISLADQYGDFDKFLKLRRVWGKAGSATGRPRTDIYLRTTDEDVLGQLDDVTEEVGVGVLRVFRRIRNLRLTKSTVFEFEEFDKLVKDALENYLPNSFTSYFTKKEVGRASPRALYPSTILHYVVSSFILFMIEKAGPVAGTRMLADAEQQREDHWLWMETANHTLGVMLDYASFNEQHEQRHLQENIESLKTFYAHYDVLTPDLVWAIDWVKESFTRIELELKEKVWHFVNGLLSGWRMTSWSNSWLNRAYLELIADQVYEFTGEVVLERVQSGGDDVADLTNSLYHAGLMLQAGEMMGFEFKPIKQLISAEYREFFRLFIDRDGVRGSLCRILGSAMSGQWSNSVVGKLIEPATKLSSVVDVIAKIARRSDLDLSFAEQVRVCAFRKWARSGDVDLVDTLVHGTRRTGGMGVPKMDGAMYELEGMVKMKPGTSKVEIVGLPTAGSKEVVALLHADAEKLVEGFAIRPADECALEMARASFKANLASSQGVGLAQVVMPPDPEYYNQRPTVKNVLRADPPKGPIEPGAFRAAYNRHKDLIAAYKKCAGAFSRLKVVVRENYWEELADKVCEQHSEVDPYRMLDKLEYFTLYGFAKIVLPEDYYEDVTWVALLESDGTEQDYCDVAAKYAFGLWNDGLCAY